MTATQCTSRRATVIAAALLALLLPSAALGGHGSEDQEEEKGKCAFSRQLEEEGPLSGYEESLRSARESARSPFGQTFRFTVQMRLKDGDVVDIDTFSVDCISCHDGINAKGHDIRMKNSTHTGSIDMTSVLGSHPIGMDYGSYSYAGNGFKHMTMLKTNMELIDGKVGCLTCHNPLNKKKHHLSVENDRSNLCKSCHIR